MLQISIQKSLILFAVSFLFSFNSFSQSKEKQNDKCLVILGAEHRYTQVANTKNSTQEVIDNINSVIEKFDSDKIIYVYSIHKALYISKKGPKMGLDSIGMIRDERLNLVNNNIITKKEVNAFTDKGLIQFLQKNNTNDVVIVGFMADYYVKETLLGGKELGYDMYFIPEAIMGKSERNKEKILTKMIKKGIKQLPIMH
ncbi:MAG: isochorismatase family protein [Bacteroidales bacterium]|nr:isochorismatase family protein [Bacteroidales bacterium]